MGFWNFPYHGLLSLSVSLLRARQSQVTRRHFFLPSGRFRPCRIAKWEMRRNKSHSGWEWDSAQMPSPKRLSVSGLVKKGGEGRNERHSPRSRPRAIVPHPFRSQDIGRSQISFTNHNVSKLQYSGTKQPRVSNAVFCLGPSIPEYARGEESPNAGETHRGQLSG